MVTKCAWEEHIEDTDEASLYPPLFRFICVACGKPVRPFNKPPEYFIEILSRIDERLKALEKESARDGGKD